MKIVCIYKSFIYVGLCEDIISDYVLKKYKVLGVREGEEEREKGRDGIVMRMMVIVPACFNDPLKEIEFATF